MVGSNLVKSLPHCNNKFTDYLRPPISKSIFVDHINIYEVLSLIESLDGNKSFGYDNISPMLVKDNKFSLCEPLTYIFNLSLSNGIIPNELKIAKIIPIHKKGQENEISNYRPISLLSVFNKILEKLVYKRLYSFFIKHKIFYKHQFGFRKNHSTSLAL